SQGRGLQLLSARELALRREERGERREVQRHAPIAVVARPVDRLADQPFVESVRYVPKPRHARQRERTGRMRDREVEEAHRLLPAVVADDEDGVVVAEREEGSSRW